MIRKLFNFSAKYDVHLQEVLKGASLALVIRVLGTILGFAVSVVIARMLGAEGSGVYYLAISVVTIAATVSRLGFDNTVVRFIASHASINEWANVRYVKRLTMRVVASASFVVTVILFLGAEWMANRLFSKPFMAIPLQLAALSVMPVALVMIQADSLRGLKKIPASQWVKTVLISLGTLLLVYPMVNAWSTNGAVAAYLIASVFTAIAAWWFLHRAMRMRMQEIGEDKKTLEAHSLFQSSLPLYGAAITGLVIQQACTIFLGVLGTADDIGVFNVANRISSLLLFPLLAMISILSPKFAAMHRENDMEGLKRLSLFSSKILTYVAIPVGIVVALSAESIMSILGSEFEGGVLVLDILLLGVVINASTGAVAELLMMTGHESDVKRVHIFGAFLLLLLLPLMFNYLESVGVAIALSGTYAFINMTMLIIVKQRIGFWAVNIPMFTGIRRG